MKLNLNLQSFYSYSNLLQNHLIPNGTFHKSDVGHLYSSLTSNIILEVEIFKHRSRSRNPHIYGKSLKISLSIAIHSYDDLVF